jgi:hypothetical protein
MSDTVVHLSLSGRMTFDDDISLAQAAQILAYLTGQPLSAGTQTGFALDVRSDTSLAGDEHSPSRSPEPPSPPAPSPAPTPRELLQVTGAKTNVEKLVAFACYLTRSEAIESFTVNDLRQVFRRAREPLPGNLNRDVDSAIRAGLVIPTETRGEYLLTTRAEEALSAGFTPQGRRSSTARPSAHHSGTGRARSTAKPAELAALDELPDAPEGVPPFHELALKRDKVLWVLAAAKGAGVDGLSNRGIEWLTDRYGDAVQSKHIGVHFDALRNAEQVRRSIQDGRIRITLRGEERLRAQAERRSS